MGCRLGRNLTAVRNNWPMAAAPRADPIRRPVAPSSSTTPLLRTSARGNGRQGWNCASRLLWQRNMQVRRCRTTGTRTLCRYAELCSFGPFANLTCPDRGYVRSRSGTRRSRFPGCGLVGAGISIYSRIALLSQVVDVFRTAAGSDAALAEVRNRRGSWFDPQAEDCLLDIADQPFGKRSRLRPSRSWFST